MSEPITLTERERSLVLWLLDEMGTAVSAQAGRHYKMGDDRCARPMSSVVTAVGNLVAKIALTDPTEKASPPRAPGASAQCTTVGVESGPGQPMDMCDLLKVAEGWGDPSAPAATLAREAAAEIRRLHEQVKTERRAGIEAAAKYHDDQAAEWSEHYTKNGNDPSAREYAKQHSADAAAIRALADKPAPDAARKGG